jgi:NAD(P)-dependent dehydrogenase (short-subunit alcohol dehydrogenase family)
MSAAAPEVRGKVYIVTGASRGVGYAICKVLHERGARFAMLARTVDEIQAHARDFGEQALAVQCDVGDRKSVDAAVAKVVDHFGGIDGLINNAGVSKIAPVERLTEDDMMSMFRINVIGALNTIQACLPHLRARGAGNIINVSSTSVHDLTEFPFLGGYASVKAAVERMTQELRFELREENIAVTCFILGSTLTHFGTGWDEGITQEAFAEWDKRGGNMPATMDPSYPAEAIVRCLETPPGACADVISFRPHIEMPKQKAMAS